MRSTIRHSLVHRLGLFYAAIIYAVILFGHLACGGDEVQGPINHAPGGVTLVQPDSGAADVPSNPTLIWTGGEDADGDSVVFDVYLGMNEPLPLARTTGDTSFTVTTGLPPATGHLWRVVARDPDGAAAQSSTWPFTTGSNSAPPAPTDPVPADGAVNVTQAAVLSWSAGPDPDVDPVTFDVYFGTTNPPAFVGNQTPSSYDPPGDLAFSTAYYWRIVAKDDQGGESTGPVWTFTTESPLNLPPSAPSDPNPGNVAINVPRDTNLSWTGGLDPDGDSVTFDVYLGTTNPPAFVQNQASSPYDPPVNLDSTTTYYWQIVAKDDQGGETSGPVWTFITGATL